MSSDCLFCRIIAGEVPSTQIYADDSVVAIRDIAPQAPTHACCWPASTSPRSARWARRTTI